MELRFDGPARPNEVVVDCTVRVQGRTGVEMEVRRKGAFVCVRMYVCLGVGGRRRRPSYHQSGSNPLPHINLYIHTNCSIGYDGCLGGSALRVRHVQGRLP